MTMAELRSSHTGLEEEVAAAAAAAAGVSYLTFLVQNKTKLCIHHSVKTNLKQLYIDEFSCLPCGSEGVLSSDMSALPKHRSANCKEEMGTYTARLLYRTTEWYNVTRLT